MAASGFNPYAAGKKAYMGGRPTPNLGKTSARTGYRVRELTANARRQAVLRRMQMQQAGRNMNSDVRRWG